ncbi:MAG: glutaredoxin 3 [Bdellovibrionota bacterium]
MAKIVVYTTEYCPYCVRAKGLLKQRGIPFEEKLIDEDDDATWDMLRKKSGMMTVPQIYADDKVIGGYTDLAALDAKDQLESLR